MLVRIARQQVRIGMFVESLEGPWFAHPFLTSRFLLSDMADVDRLRTSGVSGIVIDVSKGIGLEDRPQPSPALAPRRMRDERMVRLLHRSKRLVEDVFHSARAGSRIDTALVSEMVEAIDDAMRRNPLVMLQMTRLKTRDASTYEHSIAVCALMMQFARYLGMDEATVRLLGMGGLFHDIGKVAMPGRILTKPARLSDGEMAVMRGHPTAGHGVLMRQDDIPDLVREICLKHHERVDGRGYPVGLAGAELSRPVRMAAICDVYDAVTSVRSYKESWSSAGALGKMMTWTGQFEELLLLQFAASLGTRLVSTRGGEPEAIAAVA